MKQKKLTKIEKQLRSNKRMMVATIMVMLMIFGLLLTDYGANLNLRALVKNGGRMPVQTGFTYESDTHFGFTHPSEVHVYELTDIYHINGTYYSIGDFLINGGFYIIFITNIIFMLTLLGWGVVAWRERR